MGPPLSGVPGAWRLMSDTMSSSRQYEVLHIRPARVSDSREASPSTAMDALLESLPLGIEISPDVYDGLARLCTPAPTGPQAVVVSMDCVGPPEMKLFTLLSSARRGLPVFVYGDEFQEAKIARAIESGATGRATEDVLRSLSPAAAPASLEFDEAVTGSGPMESSAGWTTVPKADADTGSTDEGLEDEKADPPVCEEEKITPEVKSSSVRVPWLRYADAPARTAPPRQQPSPDEDEGTRQLEPDAPESSASAPLLTDEELRALLEDDIASIAPREPPGAGVDDPATEEESS